MSGGTFTTPATVTVDSLLNTYIDLPMSILSQQEYNILGSKYNTGTVNSVYYWPYTTYGELKVFLTPNASTSSTYELHITVQRPIEDITTATHTTVCCISTTELPLAHPNSIRNVELGNKGDPTELPAS